MTAVARGTKRRSAPSEATDKIYYYVIIIACKRRDKDTAKLIFKRARIIPARALVTAKKKRLGLCE
jgi:hypothetical protein